MAYLAPKTAAPVGPKCAGLKPGCLALLEVARQIWCPELVKIVVQDWSRLAKIDQIGAKIGRPGWTKMRGIEARLSHTFWK